MRLPAPIGIYPILDAGVMDPSELPGAAEAMVEAGVKVIQVRAKALPGGRFAALVRDVKGAIRDRALLVVNDRSDVALVTGITAVHVGDDDLDVAEVRRILGGVSVIGLSTHSIDEARRAVEAGPDYIGFGPMFPTGTKPTDRPVLGLECLRAACRDTSLPVVAIGGIGLDQVGDCRRAGASGVAMIGALLVAGEVRERCERAVRAFLEASDGRDSP